MAAFGIGWVAGRRAICLATFPGNGFAAGRLKEEREKEDWFGINSYSKF
jgi:hypothetical protein